MPNFHNPYHFVPTPNETGLGAVALEPDEHKYRNPTPWPPHLTHDRFVPETYSGRLVCHLTVCELLAIGAVQTPGDKKTGSPREVALFKINGEWGIPGSALRGLISSLAEAASNSALRVLENAPLSLSAGRDLPRQPLGKTYDYFRYLSPELLPLHHRDGRRNLSIAEQMFGVVEELAEDGRADRNWKAFALASRIRFFHAIQHGMQSNQITTNSTQILDSPKPPSPSLYFAAGNNGAFIPKLSLKLPYHRPQGRKFYLHRASLMDSDWMSCNPNDQAHQKAKVAPLNGGRFWFHIDFDNLSDLELQLLCYALQPSNAYHHKLGMGKPLGLGKIKIVPVGLFLINRKERYTAHALNGNRYHEAWIHEHETDFPPCYNYEIAAGLATMSPMSRANQYRDYIKDRYPALMPVLQAIELVGDPSKVTNPVHYPQPDRRPFRATAEGQMNNAHDAHPVEVTGPEMERNSYEWFVANEKEKAAGQFLRPLTNDNTCGFTELPLLKREPSSKPPYPSCWQDGNLPIPIEAATPSTVLPKSALVPPKPTTPTVPLGVKWAGPVSCKYLGRSKSLKLKFEISSGSSLQTGILWEESDQKEIPQELSEGKDYQMEYLSLGNANYRFRFI